MAIRPRWCFDVIYSRRGNPWSSAFLELMVKLNGTWYSKRSNERSTISSFLKFYRWVWNLFCENVCLWIIPWLFNNFRSSFTSLNVRDNEGVWRHNLNNQQNNIFKVLSKFEDKVRLLVDLQLLSKHTILFWCGIRNSFSLWNNLRLEILTAW